MHIAIQYPNFFKQNTDYERLLTDCGDKGGCCSRGCGCCRDRKLGPTRQFGAGHCITECGCCQIVYGIELLDEAKQSMRDLYWLHPSQNRPYYRKIMLVSLYGLTDGHTENPFNLIDGPSNHEQSGSSKEWTKDLPSRLSTRRMSKMLRIFES